MQKLNVAFQRDQQGFSLLSFKGIQDANVVELKELLMARLKEINCLPSTFETFNDLLLLPCQPQAKLGDINEKWSKAQVAAAKKRAVKTDEAAELSDLFPDGALKGHVQLLCWKPDYVHEHVASPQPAPLSKASTSKASTSRASTSNASTSKATRPLTETEESWTNTTAMASPKRITRSQVDDDIVALDLVPAEDAQADDSAVGSDQGSAGISRKRKSAPASKESTGKGKKKAKKQSDEPYLVGSHADLEFRVGEKCTCDSELTQLSPSEEQQIKNDFGIKHMWIVSHARSPTDLPSTKQMRSWPFLAQIQEFSLAGCKKLNDAAAELHNFKNHADFLKNLYTIATRLEALTLNFFQSDIQFPLTACPRTLTVLTIRHTSINQQDLANLLSASAHSIRTVSISLYHPFLDGSTLAPIIKQLPYLRELCMELYTEEDNARFVSSGAKTIFNNCFSLTRLSLLFSGRTLIPASIANDLINTNKKFKSDLARLDLTGLDLKSGGAKWQALVEELPNLAVFSTPTFKQKNAKKLKSVLKKRAVEVIAEEAYEDSIGGHYVGKASEGP